ncbi:MAG: ATP synthase subunit I [Rhodospirillales bacterium]
MSARLLASGGRARTAVALMAGRFAVLGGVLTLASLRGAAPLLAVTLGVLLARAAVLRSLPHVLTP